MNILKTYSLLNSWKILNCDTNDSVYDSMICFDVISIFHENMINLSLRKF